MCAVGVDTGYAIYVRFFAEEESRTAFVAHFAGFIGGESSFLPVRFLVV